MSDKETSLEFVDRMPELPADIRPVERVSMPGEDYIRLRALAKTAALLEEHRLGVMPYQATNVFDPGKFWVWDVSPHGDEQVVINADLHTAVRTVADKIKEQA